MGKMANIPIFGVYFPKYIPILLVII